METRGQLFPPPVVLFAPAPAAMAETAKRLRTDGEPAQAGALDAGTECTGRGGVGAAGAQMPAEPAGSAACVPAEPAGRSASMPAELRAKIVHALETLGEVEYHRRLHRKGPGPVRARCVPPEDLVHEKVETVHKGEMKRVHFRCNNPRCEKEYIKYDKWDTHVLKATIEFGRSASRDRFVGC